MQPTSGCYHLLFAHLTADRFIPVTVHFYYLQAYKSILISCIKKKVTQDGYAGYDMDLLCALKLARQQVT